MKATMSEAELTQVLIDHFHCPRAYAEREAHRLTPAHSYDRTLVAEWDGHPLQAWAIAEEQRLRDLRAAAIDREFQRREKVWAKRLKEDGFAWCDHDDAKFLTEHNRYQTGHSIHRYSTMHDYSDLAMAHVACPVCNDPERAAAAGLTGEELEIALEPDVEVVHTSLTEGYYLCYRCKERVPEAA